jgi:hypothetical protein
LDLEQAYRTRIHEQLRYLIGPLKWNSSRTPMVPWGNYQISHMELRGRELHYRFSGKFVREWKNPGKPPAAPLSTTVHLPRDPDRVFLASVNVHGWPTCQPPNGFGAELFWYYWDPKRTTCILRDGIDYWTHTVALRPILNTRLTFPEYDRLVDGDGKIRVALFYGKEDEGASDRLRLGWLRPNRDPGASDYRAVRRAMGLRGYRFRKLSSQELRKLLADSGAPSIQALPHVEVGTLKGRKATIEVLMFYGSTWISGESEGFHGLLSYALKTSGLVMYSGHSGLGVNLDLENIERMRGMRFEFKPTYQLLHLSGCVTYTYFAHYFQSKKTPRDLDLIVNGMDGYFGAWARKHSQLSLRAIEAFAKKGIRTSYQQIVGKAQNGFLLGVVGDED